MKNATQQQTRTPLDNESVSDLLKKFKDAARSHRADFDTHIVEKNGCIDTVQVTVTVHFR